MQFVVFVPSYCDSGLVALEAGYQLQCAAVVAAFLLLFGSQLVFYNFRELQRFKISRGSTS